MLIRPDSVTFLISLTPLSIVEGTGYITDIDPISKATVNYTKTNFYMDQDYACDVFQSCSKVSFIAQASLTSSIAFLDFLGANGKQQGKSVITFSFSDEYGGSLAEHAISCGTKLPESGEWEGYKNLKNCTCTYCSDSCTQTSISNEVGFFDGFNGGLVLIVYGILIAFSIIFQLIKYFMVTKKLKESGSQEGVRRSE
jgi:hypothetical protein